jgi:hypothetical protein
MRQVIAVSLVYLIGWLNGYIWKGTDMGLAWVIFESAQLAILIFILVLLLDQRGWLK